MKSEQFKRFYARVNVLSVRQEAAKKYNSVISASPLTQRANASVSFM